MFQAIAGLLAHKIDRPQHVEMSESPQRTASPIFVVPKAVRRDIEQITGLSPAAFLNACKDYAFEIPGIVQCPVVAHLTSWLIPGRRSHDRVRLLDSRSLRHGPETRRD